MKGLTVLSFGFTRGLWEGDGAEDTRRMRSYAEHLDEYVVVANSYKRHRLAPFRLAANFEAIPTNAFCFLDSFLRMLRMLRIGGTVLRARKVHLIQAQDPFFSGLVAILLGKRFRLPVNVCVYGPNVYDRHWLASHWSHRALGAMGRWVLRECRGIQVDGSMTARSLIAAGCEHERVAVKPVVPTNLERFFALERDAPKSDEAVRLLWVGRFCRQKNLPLLLSAVKLLLTRTKQPFQLQLVGDGPDEQALRALVEREGLSGVVDFHRAVSREQIPAVFEAADLFVLSSDYEGYPRVLMEAAAAALPVVTTSVSGSSDAVIDGETGFIVPIAYAEVMADKLAALLGSRDLRASLGLAGRRHMRAALDPQSNTPGQVAIWQKVATWKLSPASRATPQRLLLFNLVTDAEHPILGFTTAWIRELAGRVESLHVITMQAGAIDVPANVHVHSVGKELGYSEPRRAFEFYRHLFRILRRERIDGCFAHMNTIFAVLAGPVLRTARIPLVTWYAHPSLTRTLKLAHLFSNRVVTSLPNAYPYRREKLVVVGQGIDTTLFAPEPKSTGDHALMLCVGRISRIKDHPTLLRAAAQVPGARLVILGATAGEADEIYLRELHRLVAELRLGERVTFAPPVSPAELPRHFRACTVHVNLTPAGFGDKVAWEAMSCGRPSLVANGDFRETLGHCASELLFKAGDHLDLASKLRSLQEMNGAQRDALGLYLRSQVERLHALPRLAARILEELRDSRGTPV